MRLFTHIAPLYKMKPMSDYPKVLIVDDEASLVQLCKFVLELAGFEVRGAYNGRQALHLVAEEIPDLIVLDVMMPGMNGIEVCRRIRQDHPDHPPYILMYTADESDRTKDSSLKAGANELVTKATPPHELADRIIANIPSA